MGAGRRADRAAPRKTARQQLPARVATGSPGVGAEGVGQPCSGDGAGVGRARGLRGRAPADMSCRGEGAVHLLPTHHRGRGRWARARLDTPTARDPPREGRGEPGPWAAAPRCQTRSPVCTMLVSAPFHVRTADATLGRVPPPRRHVSLPEAPPPGPSGPAPWDLSAAPHLRGEAGCWGRVRPTLRGHKGEGKGRLTSGLASGSGDPELGNSVFKLFSLSGRVAAPACPVATNRSTERPLKAVPAASPPCGWWAAHSCRSLGRGP